MANEQIYLFLARNQELLSHSTGALFYKVRCLSVSS